MNRKTNWITQVVAFFLLQGMNFIYGKNLRGFSHDFSKNDLEFFFPSTFDISTAWEVVILYERPLRRSSRRRSSEITMTPLSVSKESWKYTWYPETTIFYMDGWWQQQFFNVMIWNHPVETTIKNGLFGVPGRKLAPKIEMAATHLFKFALFLFETMISSEEEET